MTVKNRSKICLMVSAAIMVIALVLTICGLGVNYGIDFSGGLSMEYTMGGTYNKADVEQILKDLNVGSFTLTEQGTDEVNIRIKDINQDDVQTLQASFEEALFAKYPSAARDGDVSYVGPVAGQTLLTNAFTSVLLAGALMLIYIAIRFDFNSGVAAVFGLLHDVLMMWAFMVLLRNVIQMNSSYIAAMLTIVGYSINNTIVIFDRIRENVRKMPSAPKVDVVNKSVRECLGRTINTTLTTLITIVTLYILGVDSIKEFALPIIIGIVSGVYSANMINGYVWAFLEEKKRARKLQPKKAKA
ncbi:MAG: protein translocase subunit SecF [Clostridia bacterium]|nr:protein translocase subunit SecF [Clostridia bacterium]